ncbi:MAG: nucleoside triphosphate pyrophosphohydrolase [Bacteroidota bacterium]
MPGSPFSADIRRQIEEDAAGVEEELIDSFRRFVGVVRRLRKDCPWDREQTHESVKHLMIEEVYEAVEAIDEGDILALRNELGDLLLHVLFHGDIAETDGTFTSQEVIERELAKLVRRHPHVYGDEQVGSAGDVLTNWEQIKRTEGGGAPKPVLSGVPKQLPALLRAHRIQEKVAGVGFDFPDAESAWGKVAEEMAEFRSAMASGSQAEKKHEMGDVLFALVNYGRLSGLVPEDALRGTNDRFTRRFGYIEARLAEQGRQPADATLDEMDSLWEEAKTHEKGER